MAKRFTRNIRSIENIEKQPKYTNEQNDLLSDDKEVYIRNQGKYEKITGNVEKVNNKEPDDNGNVEIDTGAMTVNEEKPDKKGNVTIDTGAMTVNDEKPDDSGNVEIDTGVMQVNGKDPDEQGNIKVDSIEQIEQAVEDTIKTADQAKSDVQSKASEASEDISGIVKTTEDARDNAESQIGDYVGEVESAKGSAIEDIDKALPEVEDKLQDLQKEMIVGGRNYIRNSNMWASKELKDFKTLPYKDLTPGIYVLSADIEIVNAHPEPGQTTRLGIQFKVGYESEKAEWLNSFYHPKEGENYKGRIHSIIEIKDKVTWIGQKGLFAHQIEGDIVRVGLPKLERGNVPSDWTPAPEDYDAKIKRLENAITELGGSI